MISKDLFDQVIESLEGRFRATISDLDKICWYSYLSEALNDNEFMIAYRMATNTLDFLPSPERLIEFVKGSENTLANKEWQEVVDSAPDRVKSPLTISARGRKALRLIGGLSAVRDCEIQFLDAKRKSFVELWREKDPEVESLFEIRTGSLKALPPAKVDYVEMMKIMAALPDFWAMPEVNHLELVAELAAIGKESFEKKYGVIYFDEWLRCLDKYRQPLYKQVMGEV